jgi:antitoxin (DNA-binding transcriptional repressor) of toxin-antitoxin stability system
MRFRRTTLAFLITAALASPALAAESGDETTALNGAIQTMDTTATTKDSGAVTGKIAADFESFAGSQENSTALVTGLRTGSEITLTQEGEPSATFTPATKPMGYGNVSTSLSLAKYQLAQQGITEPTPEQLQTALNGGTITIDGESVDYQGVLQMRADGMGWGQIAQQLGTKLGFVVSGIKAQNSHVATLPAVQTKTESTTGGASTAAGVVSGAQHGRGANHVTNAGNGASTARGHGIVTAGGGAASGAQHGRSASHVTTAGGGASAPRGQGIVTAGGGAGSGVGHGLSRGGGSGIVSASGAAAGPSSHAGGQGNGKALGLSK